MKMKINLVLTNNTVEILKSQLGEGRVRVLEVQENGYTYVEFEIRSNVDALSLIHTGQDRGIEMITKRYSKVA